MIILSSDQVFQCTYFFYKKLDKINQNFDLISKKTIEFETAEDKKLFNQLKSIGIVVENQLSFYFFGTLNEMK